MPTRKKRLLSILYIAPAEKIPGTVGGSVHVEEVARGLGRLGYVVHVICKKTSGSPELEKIGNNITLHRIIPEYPLRFFLWLAYFKSLRLAREIKPDCIIERYYNFGGAGILTGRKLKIPVMLEVNSPVIDHPGSLKKIIDRVFIFQPMRRYREFQCRIATDIIVPLPTILPKIIDKDKIHQVNWGAAVDRFNAKLNKKELRVKLGIPDDKFIFVFLGSFRRWHGIWDMVRAAQRLIAESGKKNLFFLMIGGGPERKKLEKWINKESISEYFFFTGSVSYQDVPDYLAASDAAIAPFNPSKHSQLKLGFYWSPLKIFEYMASSLPVITIDINPLNNIITDGNEGFLYEAGSNEGLYERMKKIYSLKKGMIDKMGKKGREKVVRNYSWDVHCLQLDSIIKRRLGKA